MTTETLTDRFHSDGFCVINEALSAEDLEMLRNECDRLVGDRDHEMEQLGLDVDGLDHRGQRYFIPAYDRSPVIRRFLTSGAVVDIARSLLGDPVYLFNEQYVVKAAERGKDFSWHLDSGFIDYPHPAYLSCWITLDDVTEANGTVYLLPYERAGTREVVPHHIDPVSNDRIGYAGDDPGDPLIAPAGSIACFSSTVLHRSGPNTTAQMRRVLLAQYSSEPILDAAAAAPRHLAVPVEP